MKDCVTVFLLLQVGDSSSYRNTHEGDFLIALCRYLVLQGYAPSRITVLATYSGQMFYLQNVSVDHVFWYPSMRSYVSSCYSIRPCTARSHIYTVWYYIFLLNHIFIPSECISIPFQSVPRWFIHFVCVPCFFCVSFIKPWYCLQRLL